jgi:hypothetical protein
MKAQFVDKPRYDSGIDWYAAGRVGNMPWKREDGSHWYSVDSELPPVPLPENLMRILREKFASEPPETGVE